MSISRTSMDLRSVTVKKKSTSGQCFLKRPMLKYSALISALRVAQW